MDTPFNIGGGKTSLYIGAALWSRSGTYATGQSVTITMPKGAIGLYCTMSTNSYVINFGNPSQGTKIASGYTGGETQGASSTFMLLAEPLKSPAAIVFRYGSGSGCNFLMYPIMAE